MVATQANAWALLQNGSVFQAVLESYSAAWGDFLWPFFFIVTLSMIYLKTESPTMVALGTIFGNVALFVLIPFRFQVIFYLTLVMSIALTLYAFVGRTD